jgi:fimbrial chaperone protein
MTPLKRLYATTIIRTLLLRTLLLIGWLLVPLYLVGTAQASIRVSPLSSELDLGKMNSTIITVFNGAPDKSVAIKVFARAWRLDEQGKDMRKPTQDLLIFPEQFVLPALSRRSIRIASPMAQAPRVEKSYRIMIKELPVDLTGTNIVQTGVTILTSYATAFYIKPASAMSDLAFEKVSVDATKLYFTLNNRGNAHTHLGQVEIVIKQNGKRFIVAQPQKLKGINKENILALSQRNFSMVWPESISRALDFKVPMELEMSLSCESCDKNSALLHATIN